jgi:hypothetical protein
LSNLILNTEQWPILFLQIRGEQTPEEFEGSIEAFNRLYQRGEPFSIVSHLKSYRSNPQLVARTGRWFKETEPLIRKYWVSNAMVSRSAGFRFLLSAVFLIKSIDVPYRVCGTGDEAVAFSLEHLRRRGVKPPPSLHWPFED